MRLFSKDGAALPGGRRSPVRLAFSRLGRDKAAMCGLAFLALLTMLAAAAPLVSVAVGHPPNDQSHLYEMTTEFGTPRGPDFERRFFLGADQFGRDLLPRIVYGARFSLLIGVLATGVAIMIGAAIGLLAGYFGGTVDMLLSRTIDLALSIPYLLLGLALVTIFRPGVVVIVSVIGFVTWSYVARMVRGQVLALREKEFIEAQIALGAGDLRVIVFGILPNLAGPLLVYATFLIPANILVESYLSFLGLGLPPPAPSWGQMLADAVRFYRVAWWMLAFPGGVLLATTLAFNLIGDGLSASLDPRGRLSSLVP